MSTPSIPADLPDDIQAALASDLTIDITTTGRTTGEPRRTEIWFLNVEGDLFITGTPGPRDWFANLAAHPSFTFHIKESATADLEATAAVVSDPKERSRVLNASQAAWYRGQASIEQLVEEAPLVSVTISGQSTQTTEDR